MADAPWWSLPISAVLGSFVGLSGMFLMPKAQRETLKQERERADAAIMRDKAEAIFREIAELDTDGAKVTKNAFAALHGAPAPHAGAEMKGLATLRALVAVYYPGALPIIDAHDLRQQAITEPFAERLAQANQQPLQVRAAAINAVTYELTSALWTQLGPTLREVRTYVVEAVQAYVPKRPE